MYIYVSASHAFWQLTTLNDNHHPCLLGTVRSMDNTCIIYVMYSWISRWPSGRASWCFICLIFILFIFYLFKKKFCYIYIYFLLFFASRGDFTVGLLY